VYGAPPAALVDALPRIRSRAERSTCLTFVQAAAGDIIFTLVVLASIGYFAVKAGIVPANADRKPAALESWVANTALDATLERDTKGLKNPIQLSDGNLITGVHLYAENCAILP